MTNREFERIKIIAAQAKAAKEAEAKAKAKAEAEAKEKALEFKRDLMSHNLEKYGFVRGNSNIGTEYTKDQISILYYGGELSVVTIRGTSIENIINNIPESDGLDDELAYRITDEAIEYLMKLIVK